MEMFLMALALSLLGVAVSAGLFAAATRDQRPFDEAPAVVAKPVVAAPQFFADRATGPQIPIEALLLQIEHHVRLEQAAAESFTFAPTIETLHSRTASTLVH